MTFDTDGQELVDAREAAARLGLKNARTVLDLRVHRLGFPAPARASGPRPPLVVVAGRALGGRGRIMRRSIPERV